VRDFERQAEVRACMPASPQFLEGAAKRTILGEPSVRSSWKVQPEGQASVSPQRTAGVLTPCTICGVLSGSPCPVAHLS